MGKLQKFEAKKKKRGHLSEQDLNYWRTWKEKKKQLAVQAQANYARSLIGSHGLHKPIIVDEKANQERAAAAAGAVANYSGKTSPRGETSKGDTNKGHCGQKKDDGKLSKVDEILRKKKEVISFTHH